MWIGYSLIFLSLFLTGSNAVVFTLESQFALNELNNSLIWTNGIQWTLPFSSDFTSCSAMWPGLTCSLNYVTSIELKGFSISGGTIPQSIGFLSNLQVVNLNGLKLQGTIPLSLGGLTALTLVDLGNNALTGVIPNFLVNPNLIELSLENNHLNGRFPKIISPVLEVLNLYNNSINGTVPNFISGLPFISGQPKLQLNSFRGCVPRLLNGVDTDNCTFADSPNNVLDCLCYAECTNRDNCLCGSLGMMTYEQCEANPTITLKTFTTSPLNSEFLQVGDLVYFSCDIGTRDITDYELCILNSSYSIQTIDLNLSISSKPFGFIYANNGTLLFFISDGGGKYSLIQQSGTSPYESIVSGLDDPSALSVSSNKILFKTNEGQVINSIDFGSGTNKILTVIATNVTDHKKDKLFVLNDIAYYSKEGELWSYGQNGEVQLCMNMFNDPAQFTNNSGTVFFTAQPFNEEGRHLYKIVGQNCINLQTGTLIDQYYVRSDIDLVVDPGNTIWFAITTSNSLGICGCGSTCSPVVALALPLNSSANVILRSGATNVFATIDDSGQIALLSSTLTELFSTPLGPGKFTDLRIVQSKLFAIFNNQLIGYDSSTNEINKYQTNIAPGTTFDVVQFPNQMPIVLVWSDNNLTYNFDTFNGCNFPNECYLSPESKVCVPQLVDVYQCRTYLPACTGYSVRLYNTCESYSPCITFNGMCGVGYNCNYTAGSQLSCSDVDECSLNSLICGTNQICVNSIGSYSCQCNTGYTLNGSVCVDVNECLITGVCSTYQNCTNTIGSYNCSCFPGYVYNGTQCYGTNLCDYVSCGVNSQCINANGSYLCQCLPGYTNNSIECVDVDECQNVNQCGPLNTCVNTPGSYYCNCSSGFIVNINSTQCIDINECVNTTEPICGLNSNCTNTPGNYSCNCLPGFVLNSSVCTDINECELNSSICGLNNASICTNTAGSYNCSCIDGFYWNTTYSRCDDVDECLQNPCPQANFSCNNTIGSYACYCFYGYILQGNVCVDINECSIVPSVCPPHSDCINTNGSYSCPCHSGYITSGGLCIDVNECVNFQTCSINADCVNLNGSYSCTCKSGFYGDGINCTDINECELPKNLLPEPSPQPIISPPSPQPQPQPQPIPHPDSSHPQSLFQPQHQPQPQPISQFQPISQPQPQVSLPSVLLQPNVSFYPCSPYANCTNLIGSYLCTCKTGFIGTGLVCSDINECDTNSSNCDLVSSICQNTFGSFVCLCKPGYILNGTVCQDVNECLLSPCAEHARCFNQRGSHICQCEAGWIGDGNVNCADIDECSFSPSPCPISEGCVNTPGSYSCVCPNGYRWNGSVCIDLDDCQDPNANNCSVNATCNNTPGGFYCTCKYPYTGDGVNCYNHCTPQSCAENSNCTNTEDGHYCQCIDGWIDRGDGNCTDINECDGDNQCDINAICRNTPGSYRCICNLPYVGDGFQCTLTTPCIIDSEESVFSSCDVSVIGAIIRGNVSLMRSVVFASLRIDTNSSLTINVQSEKRATTTSNIQVLGNLVVSERSVFVLQYGSVVVNGNLSLNGTIEKAWSDTEITILECINLGPRSLFTITLTRSDTRNLIQLIDYEYPVFNNTMSVGTCIVGYNAVKLQYDNSCTDISILVQRQPSPIKIVLLARDLCERPLLSFQAWPFIILAVVLAVIVAVIIIILAVPSLRRKLFSLRRRASPGAYQMGHKALTSRSNNTTTVTHHHDLFKEESTKGIPIIPKPPFTVVAIADYKATENNQISITRGQKYEVTRVDDGQYWYQSRGPGGKLGWFPASYAKMQT